MDDSQYSTAPAAFVCFALMVGMMVSFAGGPISNIRAHDLFRADSADALLREVRAHVA